MARWQIWTALLMLVLAAGCGQGETGRGSANSYQQEAEQFIGLALPGAAQQVYTWRESGIDTLYYVRFDCPPASAEAFVDGLGMAGELRDGFDPFGNEDGAELPWWQPGGATRFAGGSVAKPGKVYELLVDRSDAAVHRVYLRVYSL
ncbi:MAG TPA: hypothetical protein VFS21_09415 [Roseiflexaceae bacterium]|nr:hypothetical protein [Roseiflexaceae bacterium]